MQLELISFKLCPFVQRAIIALKYCRIPYDITYIDIMNPPAWFAEVSPFEQVPVLRVDGVTSVFESAVIGELVNEIGGGRLHPQDPVARAVHRAWIAVASDLLGQVYQLTGAQQEAAYRRAQALIVDRLELLEAQVAGPFFGGEAPGLIDFSIAPLFMRLELLGAHTPVVDESALPKVAAWRQALSAMAEVRQSVTPEFVQLFRAMVVKRGPFTADRHGLVV